VAIGLVALFSYGVINWDFPVWFSVIMLLSIAIIKNRFQNIPNTVVLGASALASLYFTWYCVNHLPVKDFRPYAVGKNIQEGMSIPDGAPHDSIVMMFQYKKGGVMHEFTAEQLPEDLDTYEFVDRIDKVVRKGYVPPIHDFAIVDANGSDFTEDFLNREGYSFMLVSYDLSKANTDIQPAVNAFVEQCDKAGIPFFGMTSTSFSDADKFRHEHQNQFQYYNCDATTLKTIIRSNPGLVLLRKGTVEAMWHYNDFPQFEEVKTMLLSR
jgi:hypothetical protein